MDKITYADKVSGSSQWTAADANELKGRLNELIPDNSLTINQELSFSANAVMDIANKEIQTGNYSFTLATSGNISGTVRMIYIQANGTGTFNFSSDFIVVNSSITPGSVLTNEVTYLFSFLYDGSKVLVNVAETADVPVTPPDTTSPTISSATVENASPSDLVIVFDEVVQITDPTGLSVNFTSGTTKTLSSVSGTGTNTLTFALSSPIEFGDTFTFEVASGTNIQDTSGNLLQPVSQAVTNNVEEVSTLTTIDWSVNPVNVSQVSDDLTATGGTTWNNARAQASQSLAGDGSVEFEMTSNSLSGVMIALDRTSGNTQFNQCDYQLWHSEGSGAYFYGTNTTATNSGILGQIGDRIRITRTGTVVKAQYNRTGTWVDIVTYGLALSNSLFIYAFFNPSLGTSMQNGRGDQIA